MRLFIILCTLLAGGSRATVVPDYCDDRYVKNRPIFGYPVPLFAGGKSIV